MWTVAAGLGLASKWPAIAVPMVLGVLETVTAETQALVSLVGVCLAPMASLMATKQLPTVEGYFVTHVPTL